MWSKRVLYDENRKINGVKYFDKISNNEVEIKSNVVINATGANADNINLLMIKCRRKLTFK